MEEGKLRMEVVSLRKSKGDTRTKAYADVSVNEALLIKGFRLVDGKNGLFVSMPGRQGTDGKWYDEVFLLNDEAKEQLEQAVIGAYETQEA